MNGTDVIRALKRKLSVTSDKDLASRLGITYMSVQNWKNRPSPTPLQFANLVQGAAKAATKQLHVTAIRPIVEFYRIQKCLSSQGAQYELFSSEDGHHGDHPYKLGLKEELATNRGVYVFFDSRGKAIYAGKAKRQNLWKEMNLAFNRDRHAVQKIERVRHPENRVGFKTTEEKSRQIGNHIVPLSELAFYFSAYQVITEMIDELEALLVRSFANDLLNIKMERFGRQRKKKKK